MDTINLSVVRESFGRAVYTHKTYEKAADICACRESWIKRINIILLGLTTGSAVGAIFTDKSFIYATSILSTVALFFILYQKDFNYEKRAYEYKLTAKKLWFVRDKYQNLISDIMAERFTPDENANKRDLLLEELNEILDDAPNTFPKAYSKAQVALKIDEEMTFSDHEIDQFLPENLRKK